MRVLYAESTGEVELSGTVAELHRLARGLRKEQEAFLLDSHIDPTPYDRAFSSIETTLTSGGAAVSLEHQALRIEGGKEAMELLALNIEGFADEGDLDSHLHIEYFPGHDYRLFATIEASGCRAPFLRLAPCITAYELTAVEMSAGSASGCAARA